MDGRIQEAIIRFIKAKSRVEYVDTITEPGPNKVLAKSHAEKAHLIENIRHRLAISINHHKSKNVFISGHYDCAGNPAEKKAQISQIEKSIELLKEWFPQISVNGLWINEKFEVEEL